MMGLKNTRHNMKMKSAADHIHVRFLFLNCHKLPMVKTLIMLMEWNGREGKGREGRIIRNDRDALMVF